MKRGGHSVTSSASLIGLGTTDRLLKAIFENASVALFVLDEHQHCVFMNAAAEALSGYTVEEVQGRPLHDVIHHKRPDGSPYPMSECPIDSVLPKNKQARGEDVFVRRNGEFYPVAYIASPIQEDGKTVGTVLEVRDLTDERQAEFALRRSEERFRTLVTTQASLVWVADVDGSLLEAPLWEQFTGQPPEEARGWGWLQCVHPDDRATVRASWEAAIERLSANGLEYRLRFADGELRYVRDSFSPIFGEDGRLREWIGTVTDITEQKRSDETRAWLAAIIASSEDAIVSKNLDGVITSWNESAQRLFGYTPEEAIGKHITMIIPEERRGEETEILARLRRGERIEHFETIRQRKDGALLNISLTISPIVNAQGEIVGASKIARDITERKRADAALEEQKRTLETLNSVSASLAADLDLHRLVQVVTDAGTTLSRAEFGAFFYNVVSDVGEAFQLYTLSGVPREAFEKFPMPRNTHVFGPTFRGEGVMRSDDITKDPRYGQNPPYHGMPEGHLPVRSYLAVPVISRSGEVLGGLFFGHSETGVFTEKVEGTIQALASHAAMAMDNARLYDEARRANETLEESVRQRTLELEDLNRELESFNYSVSHDLRTPLRGIEGFSQMLLEDYGGLLDETGRAYVNRIRAGTIRMARLIDDLLDLSRLTRSEVVPDRVDLAEIARDVIAELRERDPGRRVEFVSPECLETVGDPALLRVALENLLGNAWKFTKNRELARIELGTVARNGKDVFFVRDNGVGFSMEYADKLFVPFQRLHGREEFEGSGIGLATVQRVIRKHGGELWAEGEEDFGATFYFSLSVR